MLNAGKPLVLFMFILISFVSGRNGCRQCLGTYTIYLDDKGASEADARKFAQAALSECATGGEIELGLAESDDCAADCTTDCKASESIVCKIWHFGNAKVWRFCGNGKLINFTKPSRCYSGICAQEFVTMECCLSVNCKTACECAHCYC